MSKPRLAKKDHPKATSNQLYPERSAMSFSDSSNTFESHQCDEQSIIDVNTITAADDKRSQLTRADYRDSHLGAEKANTYNQQFYGTNTSKSLFWRLERNSDTSACETGCSEYGLSRFCLRNGTCPVLPKKSSAVPLGWIYLQTCWNWHDPSARSHS
jgi:hypothetical protein